MEASSLLHPLSEVFLRLLVKVLCSLQPEASLTKLSQSDYLPQISIIDKVPQGEEMVKPTLPGSGALKRLLAPTIYSNGAAHKPGSCAFSSILWTTI